MRPALGVVLLALAGCSYPHLIEDRKLDEDYLARIEAGTAHVCSIVPTKPIPHEVITVGKAREKFAHTIDEELKPDETEAYGRTLQAFGFTNEKADLRASALDMLAEEVAAFYDPVEKKFFIIDRDVSVGFWGWFACWVTNRDLVNEVTASHELVHAFEDQVHDLDKYWKAEGDNDDATLARQAVIEGEAVYFSLRYLGIKGDIDLSREDLLDQTGPAMESAPRVLRELLVFPYWAGYGFEKTLRPPPEAKDAPIFDPWKHPPRSTAEVIHPERYLGDDVPPRLRLGHARAPDGFALVRENVLGAFLAGVLVGDSDARGWVADRYRVFEDTKGRLALAWALRFDTPEDATAFADRYRRFQATKGVKEAAVWVVGDSVAVAEAPDPGSFAAVREAAWLAKIDAVRSP